MACFPMLVELKDMPCLVVGGGQVALHKVKVLLDFGARVTVVAPDILPELFGMEGVNCRTKMFEEGDLKGQRLVVAAAGDSECDRILSQACRREKIPLNVVDSPKDCSFFFPAYLKEGEVVCAFSSSGQSPVVTQYLKEQMRPVMTAQIGEVSRCLGELRKTVQQRPQTRRAAKQIYQEILRLSIELDRVPAEEEIGRILERCAENL